MPIDGFGEEVVSEGQNTPFNMDFCRSCDSNRKEKVQQQQGQVIGLPASNLVVKGGFNVGREVGVDVILI